MHTVPTERNLAPVVAAGVGVRRHARWALRAASFRIAPGPDGPPTIGIASPLHQASSALIELLAGYRRPAHGELRVLGEDLTTAAGRMAARRLVGVARPPGRARSRGRIQQLISHAARAAGLAGPDQAALTAAILDRLSLTAWAGVTLRAAPPAIRHRALLAAAAVHEPALLLIDHLFDALSDRGAAALADGMRELALDTAVLVTGHDARLLGRVCDEVLTLRDGVLIPG